MTGVLAVVWLKFKFFVAEAQLSPWLTVEYVTALPLWQALLGNRLEPGLSRAYVDRTARVASLNKSECKEIPLLFCGRKWSQLCIFAKSSFFARKVKFELLFFFAA